MNPFRQHHTLTILKTYEIERGPLDLFCSAYFRANRAIGSKDRKEISTTIYAIYRQLGAIDYLAKSRPITWEERLEIALKGIVIPKSAPDHIQVSFPKVLYSMIENSYGKDQAMAICKTLNEQAPLTLRANALKTSREELTAALTAELGGGISLSPCQKSVVGLVLSDRAPLHQTAAYKAGLFEIQDEASQIAAHYAEPGPKLHILDYCAGAGGKALAMAPEMNGSGQLYLHDVRLRALAGAKERLKRAGVQNIQITPPDSKQLARLKGHMDLVFVDAPCSGTGTYRRNPEQKWKFNETMLAELIAKQQEIFEQALSYLKPKGRIVYATCSLLAEENTDQAAFFKEKFGLIESKPPFKALPQSGGMDGFFATMLQRS